MKAQGAFRGADDAAHGPLGTDRPRRAVVRQQRRHGRCDGLGRVSRWRTPAPRLPARSPTCPGSRFPRAGQRETARSIATRPSPMRSRRRATVRPRRPTRLGAAPQSFVPQVLARPRWDAQEQASRLAKDLDGVADLLRGSAAFAGKDRPMRYLVLSQNPAELRGTGGIWGAYAILTLENGRASVSPARPTQIASRTFRRAGSRVRARTTRGTTNISAAPARGRT